MAQPSGGRNPEALLKRHGGGGSADFGSIDHEDVAVATALRPVAGAVSKAVQCCVVVARRDLLTHALQPCVAEARGVGINAGKLVVVAEDHGHVMLAAQAEECFVSETLMPWFDRMPQRQSVELLWKLVQKAANILPVELPAGGEHPQDRPELRTQRRQALGQKSSNALAGIGQLRTSD